MKDNPNDDSQINDLNIPSLNGAVHSILKENKLIHSSNHISLSAKTAKNVHLNHLSLTDLKLAIVIISVVLQTNVPISKLFW